MQKHWSGWERNHWRVSRGYVEERSQLWFYRAEEKWERHVRSQILVCERGLHPFWDAVCFLWTRHFSLRSEGLRLGSYYLGTYAFYRKIEFRGTNPWFITLYNSLLSRSLAASSLWALSPRPSLHAHSAFPPHSLLSPLSNTGPKLKDIFCNGSSATSVCSRGRSLASTCKPLGDPLGLGSLALPCCRGAASSQPGKVGFALPPLVPSCASG